MVKHAQSAMIEENSSMKRISKRECSRLIRAKLNKREEKAKAKPFINERIQDLLNESSVECSVCLQTLLKPAVAQCGHCFCLNCAQVLAKNDFSCGICHNYEPSYNLTLNRANQELVNIYLNKCQEGEKRSYEMREKAFEEKEEERSIGKIAVGSLVDFWCVQSKCWKGGVIRDVSQDGIVLLSQEKGPKTLNVNILSRRLAKYRYFTKEKVYNKVIQRAPPVTEIQQKKEKRTAQSTVKLEQPEPQMFFNIFDSKDQYSLESLESGEYHSLRYTF